MATVGRSAALASVLAHPINTYHFSSVGGIILRQMALVAVPLGSPNLTDPGGIAGARVAAIQAILATLRYGSYEKYDLLLPVDEPGKIARWGNDLALHGIEPSRVGLIPHSMVAQALQREDYLAVFDTGKPFLDRLDALVAPLGNSLPCVCLHHSLSYAGFINDAISMWLARLPPYDTLLCSSSDARIALNTIFERVAAMYPYAEGRMPRMDNMPLGIFSDEYVPSIAQDQARKLLGLPPGTFMIYLGRFSRHDKADLDILLRALLALSDHEPPVRLILAGSDVFGYAGHLERRATSMGISDRVHIMPNISTLTKRLLLWASDIFVSPADSVQESFGVAILEAMAAHLPVVASDWGGYRDIVQHEVTGFLVPTLWSDYLDYVSATAELGVFDAYHEAMSQGVVVDEDAFTANVKILVDSPTLRTRMGVAAAKRVESEFSWRAIVPQYEQLWAELHGLAQGAGARGQEVRFPYWRAFSHYPSAILKGEDLVCKRDFSGRVEPPVNIRETVGDEWFRFAVSRLERGDCRVSDIARRPGEMQSLLWLAKCGAVAIKRKDEEDAGGAVRSGQQ